MKDIVDSCSKPAWKWDQKEKENVRKGNRNITTVVMSRGFFLLPCSQENIFCFTLKYTAS